MASIKAGVVYRRPGSGSMEEDRQQQGLLLPGQQNNLHSQYLMGGGGGGSANVMGSIAMANPKIISLKGGWIIGYF